ncbi:MAG: hypothetical protein IPP71_07865 [Bacteroidetes bacterium]|nr:hypothetical protein [Bacteroidota bacterium]
MKYNNLKKVVRIFCLLTFTILTIKVFSNIDSKEFDIPSLAIENSILLLISATVLVNLTGDTEQYLFKNYRFWMALAVFMYFSVSTIVFATGNFLLDDHVYLRRYTWIIHSILSMVANLLYIKGILCLPNKKK